MMAGEVRALSSTIWMRNSCMHALGSSLAAYLAQTIQRLKVCDAMTKNRFVLE
jgi:hypothetical protein